LGKFNEDLIIEPEWIRVGGHRLYRIVIGGLLCFCSLNPSVIPPEWHPALLAEDGTWRLLAGEVEKIPCLKQWFSAHAKAERMRESRGSTEPATRST
jgi:hypothetical protein